NRFPISPENGRVQAFPETGISELAIDRKTARLLANTWPQRQELRIDGEVPAEWVLWLNAAGANGARSGSMRMISVH
ncbi:MAG: hypothetical protein OXD44_09110, partial [Gammaproteobacteria bacterium]|nr:hypothetical protein [Gammaproteobacteria bacterium]